MNLLRNLVERKATIEESGELVRVCVSACLDLSLRRNNLLAWDNYTVLVKEEREVASVDD